MSITSNSRKENANSHADQQLHGPMGMAPELSQLYDRDLTSELPSKLEQEAEQPSVAAELEADQEPDMAADQENMAQADIEENKRASWGQAPADETGRAAHVPDADWNRSTEE